MASTKRRPTTTEPESEPEDFNQSAFRAVQHATEDRGGGIAKKRSVVGVVQKRPAAGVTRKPDRRGILLRKPKQ